MKRNFAVYTGQLLGMIIPSRKVRVFFRHTPKIGH